MSNLPPAAELDPAEPLGERDFLFVQGILAGKTLAEAFRGSRDTSNWKDNSVWCEASKLHSTPKVRQWLDQFRRQAMQRGTVTLEGHLAELESLKVDAKATGNYGAAVKAEELRGKAAGVYLGDESGKLARVPAAQLIEIVRQALGGEEGEWAAQKLAKRLGVALLPMKPLTLEHDEDVA